MTVPHGLTGVADAGAFLARLTRLDPSAVVRLRPAGEAGTTLWARLPWGVLVARTVEGAPPRDVTVAAAELLAAVASGDPRLPAARDRDWRWGLPPGGGRVVETLTAGDLRRVAAAAAGTLRTAAAHGVGGRAIGQRMLRDALLDHVAIVVTPDGGDPVEVPQRLVQGVVRMGFLGAVPGPRGADGEPPVAVRVANRWVALSAPYGVAWLAPAGNLAMRFPSNRTNG